MMYVTVGGHPQDFSRLVRAADALAPCFDEKVIIQKGVSAFSPVHASCFDYVTAEEGEDYIRKASLVISHAGVGTIILARKHNVPLIVVPRRKEFGEHVNDHQLEICEALRKMPGGKVYVVEDPSCLGEAVVKIRQKPGEDAVEGNGRNRIVETVRSFIDREKILMINPMDATYGSTHRMRKLRQGLAAHGWQIDYVESNYDGGEQVVDVKQPNNAAGFLRGTLRRALLALFGTYDTLFTQTLTPLTVPSIIVAKCRRKKVVVDWDDLSWVLQKNRFRAALVRFCEHVFIRLPDAVLVPNRYLYEYGKSRGGKKIEFAPHGVDFDRFDPARYDREVVKKELGLEGKTTLGFLASFTTGGVGDLDFIYDAAGSVMERRPELSFLVIGGGPLFEEYRALAERKGLRNTVFTGLVKQEEIPKYLSAVDVALIYMRDNINNRMKTSLKVGEYLAMNKLVVGHLAGQTKDDFAPYCLTCSPDREAFAAQVLSALEFRGRKPEPREELQKKYTWQTAVGTAAGVLAGTRYP